MPPRRLRADSDDAVYDTFTSAMPPRRAPVYVRATQDEDGDVCLQRVTRYTVERALMSDEDDIAVYAIVERERRR